MKGVLCPPHRPPPAFLGQQSEDRALSISHPSPYAALFAFAVLGGAFSAGMRFLVENTVLGFPLLSAAAAVAIRRTRRPHLHTGTWGH